MSSYDLVTGDTGSKLQVTCKDSAGTIIDLTGATVNLHWDDVDGALVSKAMTISNPTGGVAEYQFLGTEIFTPSMKFEVEITDAFGYIITSLDSITLKVREQIG